MLLCLSCPISYFHIRSSRVNGCGRLILIFLKSVCFGLSTRLYSSGMIAEGTRSINEVPFLAHSVPISFVEFDAGDTRQSGFKSL